MCERSEAEEVSPKFPKENTATVKLQAKQIFRFRVPFVKAESMDSASAKSSPLKMRHFQTFEKTCHEKWPFITVDEQDDTCRNSEVHSSVLK